MLENLMGLSLLLDRSVGCTPDLLQKLGPIQAPSLVDPVTNLDSSAVEEGWLRHQKNIAQLHLLGADGVVLVGKLFS